MAADVDVDLLASSTKDSSAIEDADANVVNGSQCRPMLAEVLADSSSNQLNS